MSTGERDVTTRLRDALAHQTASVPAPEDRWEDVEVRAGQLLRRRRWNRAAYLTIGLAAAVVTVVVAASALEPGSSRRVTTVAPATSPQTPVSRGPGPGPETTTASPAPSTSAPQPASAFHYQPLWPFAGEADAAGWQARYRAGGQQPWHLDPATTAISFTTGYLGYADINLVVDGTVGPADAHVAVGYAVPSTPNRTSVAAIIHLVKLGAGADAPWEVVGTDDSRGISLAAPAYGSRISSPVAVGGRITGVDESIHVRVLQQSSGSTPIGDRCCVPAGGTDTAWATSVGFAGARDAVVTLVASTGGHLLAVERFAVTAGRR